MGCGGLCSDAPDGCYCLQLQTSVPVEPGKGTLQETREKDITPRSFVALAASQPL